MISDKETMNAAIRLCQLVTSSEPQVNQTEVLKIEDGTWSAIMEIDGVDYIATIMRVPRQRPRHKAP